MEASADESDQAHKHAEGGYGYICLGEPNQVDCERRHWTYTMDRCLPIAPDGRHRWWFQVVSIKVYALCRVRVPSSRAANLPKKLRQLGGMYVAEQRECGSEETELNEKAYHPLRPEPMLSKGPHWQRRAYSTIRSKELHVCPGDDSSTIKPAKEISGVMSLARATNLGSVDRLVSAGYLFTSQRNTRTQTEV